MNDLESLKRIRNGAKVQHTFPDFEYASRQASLRGVMASMKVDSVLFTSIHNVNYHSDFLYTSFGRPYGLVVTGDKVVSISANIDGGQPWRRTAGTDNVVYTDWQRDNFFRAIQQEVANKGRVGIEFDHMNLDSEKKLRSALPAAELVRMTAPILRCHIGSASPSARNMLASGPVSMRSVSPLGLRTSATPLCLFTGPTFRTVTVSTRGANISRYTPIFPGVSNDLEYVWPKN